MLKKPKMIQVIGIVEWGEEWGKAKWICTKTVSINTRKKNMDIF